MKIIVLVVLFVIAGVSYYGLIDNDKGAVELTYEVLKTPEIHEISTQDIKTTVSTAPPSTGLVPTAINLQRADHKELIAQSMKTLSSQSQPKLTDDIIGVYDPSAIAPEDESVQMGYTDVMVVSVSSGIAPESGSEMMPISNDIPLMSEKIGDSRGPESPQ